MNCEKCNCVLEDFEAEDIELLAMKKICTQCLNDWLYDDSSDNLNDWLDDKVLDITATGGESVE